MDGPSALQSIQFLLGWMQLVILIYQITGASQDIFIYMLIRLFVSSYLVLNGFGHFMYFFKENKERQVELQEGEISSFQPTNKQGFVRIFLVKIGL